MQPLTESITRAEALRQSLVNLDPASAEMLGRLTQELRDIATTLRECSILLSLPAIAGTSLHLRDRIDLCLGVEPRAMPISQVDGS